MYDPRTRPIDVMGDVASHGMVNTDGVMNYYYNEFKRTLKPWQKDRLKKQYEYSKKNLGEKRDFNKWLEMSGLPGYFRGYAFKQWEKPNEMYTPEQRAMFDDMMNYLRGK